MSFIENRKYFQKQDQIERTLKMGFFLELTEEELSVLPKEGEFDCEIWDHKEKKAHKAKVYIAYDSDCSSLHQYFYYWHFCPCHRGSAIEDKVKEWDGNCDHGRFYINSITHPHLPGINMYFEGRVSYDS